jgi:hypothetical protein
MRAVNNVRWYFGQRIGLDGRTLQSHPCVATEVETMFLRPFKPMALGDQIDGWNVCSVGGWD